MQLAATLMKPLASATDLVQSDAANLATVWDKFLSLKKTPLTSTLWGAVVLKALHEHWQKRCVYEAMDDSQLFPPFCFSLS